MQSSMRFAASGFLVAVATLAAVATSTGWPARFPLHLALFVLAGLVWAGSLALLSWLPRGRRDLVALVAVAVLLRVPAWLAAPAHSDDVYRYAWDGRVSHAGINPYRHAPASPALAALRDGSPRPLPDLPAFEREPARATTDESGIFARINNRDLPTIYPPAAQILFAAASWLPLSPIASLKLCLGACDLAVLALLVGLLRRRGLDPRWAAVWGWSPLVAIELGQNVHLDALAILGLVGALDAWERGGRVRAGLLLGLSTAAKLIAAPLFLVLRAPRTVVAGALVIAAVSLPFASAGSAMVGSTGEFARRWRSNDGAYALLQAATDRAVCRALAAPLVTRDGTPCDQPFDIWPHERIASLISGRAYRAALYPDELSGFAARLLAGAAVAVVLLSVLRKGLPPVLGMEWILGALLLFTPALKPWYVTWLLPLAAVSRRPAWVALAALVPLAYEPMAAWLGGAPWRDPVWTRLVEHGACWGLLAAGALSARWRGRGSAQQVAPVDGGTLPDAALYRSPAGATLGPSSLEV